MPTTGIDFGLEGIGHQLKSLLLRVPLYQRSYAWETDQVTDFCSDLRNAFNGNPREHFMGTIVLSEDDNDRVTVIDGQQRLATAALFLAALRDYYIANGEGNRADGINRDYLNSYSDSDDAFEPRLKLNSEDDEFFRQYIVTGSTAVAPTRDSHPLISASYEMLYSFIEAEAVSAGTGWVQRLVEWRKFVESDVRVIHVTVPTESDAFLIFETLNDRGAKLTLADLLKSYLFGKAATTTSGLDQVRERWLFALGALDTDQDLFVNFLRQYWSSKNGATRERDLYKKIKTDITNAGQAIAFAGEIEAASILYAALLDSGNAYWSGWGSETKANIETLGRLGLEQNRPMLLAVLQYFSKAEAKKALRLAVNWGVRGLVVGGIGGGSAEKAYCDAAVAVRNGSIPTAAQLLTPMESIVATDEEFKAAFAIARVVKTNISRYYLLAIEAFLAHDAEPELVPNSNEDQVNLEHVLPKKGTEANWPLFAGDLKAQWVDRFGNHCLMKKSDNNAAANEPFATKKPFLELSQLELTKQVGATTDWTPEAIAERQENLATLAPQVWKRSL